MSESRTERASGALAAGPPLSRAECEGVLRETLAVSEAEQTEVLLEASELALTRFANNQIHQNVAQGSRTLTVRARTGRRVGSARTARLDASGLRQVCERALSLARLAPDDPELPEVAPPEACAELPAFVAATAASTPEARADLLAPVLAEAERHGLDASGAHCAESLTSAFANSSGVLAWQPHTFARFTCTVRSPNSSGWVDRYRRDIGALDLERLGAIAIEKAERGRDPVAITPGPFTVVLEPAAAAELVGFLAVLGLGAQADQEGRSFLAGRMGERVTGPRVTLVDDPFDSRAFGLPFDAEGVPRRRVTLIDRGIARGVVHDRRTAARGGVRSTGHASPPPALEGPLPMSLVLAGEDGTLDELIAATEHGLLVTRFWYNRVVDPRRTIVTGMTRDGTFLIEHGKLGGAVRNLRYNVSVLEMLERATHFSRDLEPLVSDWDRACVVAPAIRSTEFRFTGISPS